MDAVQIVRDQIYLAHGWFLGAVKDLTDEQVNFLPPGTAHPIGAIIQHVLFVEDDTVNRRLCGGQTLWERERWGASTGLASLAGADEDAYRSFRMPATALDDYRKSVWAASDEYLEHLDDVGLFATLPSTQRRSSTTAAVLGILLNHTAIHVGEISATKGFQGLRGSPL